MKKEKAPTKKQERRIKRQLETRVENGHSIDKEMGRKYGVSEIKCYQVVDKIEQGDYIFIHHNGYVFNANSYPHNLRDGIASRAMWTGETVEYKKGGDTKDIMRKPYTPTIQSVFGGREDDYYGDDYED